MMSTVLPYLQQKEKTPLGWKIAWLVTAGAAIATGAISFRYLLPVVPNPIGGTNLLERRAWLVTHAVSASLALLSGPWQFRPLRGLHRPPWHRWNGRFYVAAVAVGWVSSIPIALHAQAGPVAQAGFVCLGLAWAASTAIAIAAILNHQPALHRRWMLRSYALSASAISLRVMLPLSMVANIPFDVAYPTIAWSCWLVNLAGLELYLGVSKRDGLAPAVELSA